MKRAQSGTVALGTRHLALMSIDGLSFKDHNGNGRLDPYEDWRLPPVLRARDLLVRMTLEEKAAAMLHANPPTLQATALPGAGASWDQAALRDLVLRRGIHAFLNRLQAPPADLARQANALQALAEQSRLGIPVLLSSDPRSHFSHSQGVSIAAGGFTQWPDPTGFGAIGSPERVKEFADAVRREYRAVGIRMSLSPMADLALHPRWHRSNGCFGSDPAEVSALVRAYVSGMQCGSTGLGADSVVSVVKHWVGYGATGSAGFDAHNHYGRHLELASSTIESHILPFVAAISEEVGCVMPAYGMPRPGLRVEGETQDIELVGMGFNRQMIEGVLRGRLGFEGVVMSDWHITDDCTTSCIDGAPVGQRPVASDIAMPWGVEHLNKGARFTKAIFAGVDQFGGADDPRWIVDEVRSGHLPEERVDRAVLRVLVQRFQLGLFEDPFVEESVASQVVGAPSMQSLALEAQRRSPVLIKCTGDHLPLRPGIRLYLDGMNDLDGMTGQLAQDLGWEVVGLPEDADLAIVALCTPHEVLHPQHFFGSRYREGHTGWPKGHADLQRLKQISVQLPTVVCVYMERPTDLSAIEPLADAIVVHFGLHASVLLEVLAAPAGPIGRLPYDLPWPADKTEPMRFARTRGQGLSI